MNRKFRGFTLVEIMIVILVLGILSAAAVPAINGTLDGIKLDGAARELVHAIQYSRSLSIKEGVSYGVEFFPSTDRFRCYDKATDATIYNPFDKKAYVIDFSAEGYLHGVDLAGATFSGNRVEFNPLGEPSESGSAVLGYGSIQKTVTVTAPVGRITVN